MQNIKNTTPKDCADLCLMNTKCQGLEINVDGSDCYLTDKSFDSVLKSISEFYDGWDLYEKVNAGTYF